MSAEALAAPPAKVKTILMIDDDEMIRILFREMFWIYSDPDRTDVITVPSIAEAYEKLKEMPTPDVVVLGMSLLTKGTDGVATHDTMPSLELIKNLKAQKSDIKIIVYSRHNEDELKEKAKEAGADNYLVKGELTPHEMVEYIENL